MAQVIEVRFMNTASGATIHDCFTLASSHEEAIRLALHDFSSGTGVIKATERFGDVEHVLAGINTCWRYTYRCTVEDDEYDREMVAVLFATYKERENEHGMASR